MNGHEEFNNILQPLLEKYSNVSNIIGGDVAEHSKLVRNGFAHHKDCLLNLTPVFKESWIICTREHIKHIQKFTDRNQGSNMYNHLCAISVSIPVLDWITVKIDAIAYINEMKDAAMYYTNKILMEWKNIDSIHMDWVNTWLDILMEVKTYVEIYHLSGIVFKPDVLSLLSALPHTSVICVPPPPILSLGDAVAKEPQNALFLELNQGQEITKCLRKVANEMKIKSSAFKPLRKTSSVNSNMQKESNFIHTGNKWIIEYQKDNHNLQVNETEMSNVIYYYKCIDTTLTVKGKINAITVDSCKHCMVVFDSLVSCIEFINCENVTMHVLGKVPTISIEKTDGCQICLSAESLDAEVVTFKSSAIAVFVPKDDGDYIDYQVPSKYKSVIVAGKGLATNAIEYTGKFYN